MRSPLYLHAWLQDFYPSSNVLSPSTEEQRLQNQAMGSIPPPRNDGDKPDDGFVAVNVVELVAAADRPPATPRSMIKSLSRKGGTPRSCGGGGEAVAVTVATAEGSSAKDKPLYVAVEREAAAAAGLNSHRRAATVRRPVAWRDPRSVLLVFASLSCMGTLILLYFTLTMSRMNTRTSADYGDPR